MDANVVEVVCRHSLVARVIHCVFCFSINIRPLGLSVVRDNKVALVGLPDEHHEITPDSLVSYLDTVASNRQ